MKELNSVNSWAPGQDLDIPVSWLATILLALVQSHALPLDF